MVEKWNGEEMADVSGQTIVITGANSGLGFETAFALASKGAEIILAVRNASKGKRRSIESYRSIQTQMYV
ncbi:SDR family NAD(P)-dependent oxidoreductase [Peribacillus frigoritolerans]|uniref:SDR family NAD(P)-dependent oxidoreductase n=1 Tax=Peribacillus frigoritolerans TaxID=450367 RepID=UPI003221E7DA